MLADTRDDCTSCIIVLVLFFFLKQKTAYDIQGDWSSDVCSSDLNHHRRPGMIVYCDTSFLVSLLYEGDANHKAARNLAGRFDGQDFILCQTHQLELPASVRAGTHRTESPIPGQVARTIIN